MKIGDQFIVREYRGSSTLIQQRYQDELLRMAQLGYEPHSQNIVPGSRGGCALVLGFLLLGIPFLFWRPDDTLMVTYRKKE